MKPSQGSPCAPHLIWRSSIGLGNPDVTAAHENALKLIRSTSPHESSSERHKNRQANRLPPLEAAVEPTVDLMTISVDEMIGRAEARLEEQRQHMVATHPSRRKREVDALNQTIRTRNSLHAIGNALLPSAGQAPLPTRAAACHCSPNRIVVLQIAADRLTWPLSALPAPRNADGDSLIRDGMSFAT